MDVVYERCCGLDVHKQTVVACLVMPGSGKQPRKEIRTFGTMTADLLGLSDWLLEEGVTHVAMESTGVFWKQVWNLLENRCTVLLANARHIKAVPGRKTDVRDCEWIADLLRHGLLQPSFVPERAQRELRELTRYRTSLIRERSAEVNRVQKTLEGANIKLASVASNPMGISGKEMLTALVHGTTDPVELAGLARGKLRVKREQLERALRGQFGPHQRFLLAEHLTHIDTLDEAIARVSNEIAEQMRPFTEALERLDTIPGVGLRTAEVLVAEIGVDMSRFPSAGHLASWAGLCPGSDESAGKRRSGRTRKGSKWLGIALTEAAQANTRSRDTYLSAQYRRLKPRRGHRKAIGALRHSIIVACWHMLTTGETYRDAGGDYYTRLDPDKQTRRLVAQLQRLGHTVTLQEAAA